MVLNSLKRTLRNVQKNGVFTMINVLGLSIGMTVFVLIVQYVSLEKSYNSFHVNLPQLNRVLTEKPSGEFDAYTAPGIAPIAQNKLGGINAFCRIAEGKNLGTGVVNIENASSENSFREENFAYADGNFFTFFTFPALIGDINSLKFPNIVALSNKVSKRYFGTESSIGKTITLNNQFGKTTYTVGLVYEDIPTFSDLRYDLVFSLETLANKANLNGNEMWASLEGTGSQWLYTYVELQQNTDRDVITDGYTGIIQSVYPDEKNKVHLQQIKDMHLGESLGDPLPAFGSLKFIYLISAIAVLILVIAWFNYVNLSTASALKRAKEVGIRKVTGATKTQLIFQFLGESAILNFIALFIAVALMGILQQPYSALINKPMSLSNVFNNNFWLWATGLLIIGTLASGCYTAFVLSSFNPAKVLKGVFSKSATGIAIRKSLVVFQFCISLILISATIILYRQWHYMQEKDLGMNASQLLIIRGAEVNKDKSFGERSTEFENNLNSASFVKHVSRSGNVPTEGFNFSTSGITKQGANDIGKINFDMITIDEHYLETYEIKLIAGANFTPEMCDKSWNEMEYVLINERAVLELGFTNLQQAAGQKIQWGERFFEVRGVVKDYHHLSVEYAIAPIIFLPSNSGGYYTVKLSGAEISDQLRYIEREYKKSFAGNPFEYVFLDQSFEQQYTNQKQYSLIFTVASCMAVVIGCLGLFGLTIYSVEQRSKEIGVRKVLGSSVSQIIVLLSKDFLLLVFIAFLISVPISWWVMNQWLESFVYRIDITWWIFGIGGAFILIIAWLTISAQAFKGATANPVKSLRSE